MKPLQAINRSLKWQLFYRVAVVMLVLIPLFGFIRNEMAQRETTEDFRSRIEGAAQVLAVALREPLWDLDETQIEESVRSLSLFNDLLAVRIVESGPSQYERLFARDNEGQLVQLSVTSVTPADATVKHPFVVSWKDSDLATGELYFTDKLLISRQREQLLFLVGQLLLFGVLVLGTLYYLVQRNVGYPLYQLREAMSESEGVKLHKVISGLPENELRLLAERYALVLSDLREHQQHLTDMVLSRTRALSEANEQLESEIKRRAKIERELIQAREFAEQASDAKTYFLAHMSHELRTPLNGIIGYTQLLSQQDNLQAQDKEYLANVESCANHLLDLINRVLDLSKIEQGRMDRVDQPFSLVTLLNDVMAVVKPRCDAKGVVLQLKTASTLPSAVLGDAAKLRQILINLLGNAVKFTDQGQVILQVSVKANESISFCVEDTGSGIAQRDIERIFEPFQQAGSAAQQLREAGTGLGLSIARRFVSLLGGELHVQSTLGKGSAFSFSLILPVAAEPDERNSARVAHSLRGDFHPQLLIVDDVAHNREILARMLMQLGFKTQTASSGEEALTAVQMNKPDLIFMDIRMPGMDGISCAKVLRERYPDLPILAFTASVFDPQLDNDIRRWFEGIALKPINLSLICQQLADLLPIEFEFLDRDNPDTKTDPAAVVHSQWLTVDPDEKNELRAWLGNGSIAKIREHAQQMKDSGHSLRELADALLSLARTYDIEGLRRLIDS